jgi:hypothetical protein
MNSGSAEEGKPQTTDVPPAETPRADVSAADTASGSAGGPAAEPAHEAAVETVVEGSAESAESGGVAAAPEPETKPAPEPPPRTRGEGWRNFATAFGVLAVIALLTLGAYITRDLWYPGAVAERQTPPPPDLAPRINQLAATQDGLKQSGEQLALRVAAAEKAVAGLEAQLAALTQALAEVRDGGDTGELQDRQAALQQRLDGLQSRLDFLDEAAERAKAYDRRLVTLEAANDTARAGLEKQSGLVLALGQLRQALAGSGAYAAELDTVRSLAGTQAELQPALAALAARAATGVPAVAGLRDRFPRVAQDVVRAEQSVSGEQWYQRAANRVLGLVTVRRIGPAGIAAGGSEARLAEAEEALARGDLAAAVAAVTAIEGPGASAAASWLAEARARLAADQALAGLQAAALGRLSGPRG